MLINNDKGGRNRNRNISSSFEIADVNAMLFKLINSFPKPKPWLVGFVEAKGSFI